MAAVTLPDRWVSRLEKAISAALREFAPRVAGSPIAVFAVDCHPWHGKIGLSILTSAEAVAVPVLTAPAEMAAWQNFDFARELSSRHLFTDIEREMEIAYRTNDRKTAVEAFLSACAAAAESSEAASALALLHKAPGFRISVAHPDDGREYVVSG